MAGGTNGKKSKSRNLASSGGATNYTTLCIIGGVFLTVLFVCWLGYLSSNLLGVIELLLVPVYAVLALMALGAVLASITFIVNKIYDS
jgi:hypothetical protein